MGDANFFPPGLISPSSKLFGRPKEHLHRFVPRPLSPPRELIIQSALSLLPSKHERGRDREEKGGTTHGALFCAALRVPRPSVGRRFANVPSSSSPEGTRTFSLVHLLFPPRFRQPQHLIFHRFIRGARRGTGTAGRGWGNKRRKKQQLRRAGVGARRRKRGPLLLCCYGREREKRVCGSKEKGKVVSGKGGGEERLGRRLRLRRPTLKVGNGRTDGGRKLSQHCCPPPLLA